MIASLAAALLTLQPVPGAAWRAALPPADECAANEEFARFRGSLLDALARRDVGRLRPLVADDIFFSFGDTAGWDAFFASWKLDDPLRSGLWGALAETLMLGCARREAEMVAPYAFVHWPEFDGVGSSYLARAGAELRREPSYESEVMAAIDWHIVEDAAEGDETADKRWRRVRLADGRTGYVPEAELRSDVDYRVIFEQRGGRWLLTTFVAGD